MAPQPGSVEIMKQLEDKLLVIPYKEAQYGHNFITGRLKLHI